MPGITIDTASKSDLPHIFTLQREAYISEAEIYNDFNIPPLTQSYEEIETEFQNHLFLKVESGGNIFGSVRAIEKNNVCYIGRLIVQPSHQNRGLGSRLLKAIELKFPNVDKYELFTGSRSKKNLYIYKNNGYAIIKQQKISDSLTLILLHKNNDKAQLKVSDNTGYGS